MAELNRLAGEAARRLDTKAARDFFSSVFWFSIEQLLDVVGEFFASCDDDTPARLGVVAARG